MVAMVVDNTIFISPFDKALLSPALGDDARANPILSFKQQASGLLLQKSLSRLKKWT
jgi:hypothetical protein